MSGAWSNQVTQTQKSTMVGFIWLIVSQHTRKGVWGTGALNRFVKTDYQG